MSVHVNMLDRSEARRVEGIVNRSFYATVAIVLLVSATVMGGLLASRYAMAKNHLRMVQERWAEFEPRHNEILDARVETHERRKIVQQLVAWRKSGMNWNRTLQSLPAIVPETVQLTRLQVLGDSRYLEPEEDQDEYVLSRQFRVKLDGRASGQDGDQTIISLVNQLPKTPEFNENLTSAKLLMMQTDTQHGDDELVRTFAIEGYFKGWSL